MSRDEQASAGRRRSLDGPDLDGIHAYLSEEPKWALLSDMDTRQRATESGRWIEGRKFNLGEVR